MFSQDLLPFLAKRQKSKNFVWLEKHTYKNIFAHLSHARAESTVKGRKLAINLVLFRANFSPSEVL